MVHNLSTTYDQDFFAWAMDTAKLLRNGMFDEVDIDHVAEEIESMGKSEKREMVRRVMVLFAHLLKWKYQPAKRSRSWQNTILTQRIDIVELLTDTQVSAQFLSVVSRLPMKKPCCTLKMRRA